MFRLSEEEMEIAKTCRNGRFFWKNIYGAPLDTSGDTANSMNENPELGSLWKGRILMQIIAEKTEKPVRRVQPIPQEDVEMARQYTVYRKFSLMFQINQAIALPKEDSEFEVVVRVAECEFTTGRPVICKGLFNRYNYRLDPKNSELVLPYVNVADIGSIFIYLRQKVGLTGKMANIAYFRAPVLEFTETDPQSLRWVELQPDLAVGEITEAYKAGLVGIRLSIHDETANGPINWPSIPFWKSKVKKRPGNVKVRAYIF